MTDEQQPPPPTFEDHEDLTPKTVERARNYKGTAQGREAALRVLDSFRAAVAAGQTPHPSVLSYLAEAFADIVDTKVSAEAALGLTRGKGQGGSIEERDFEIAAYIEQLVSSVSPMKVTDAIAKACEKFDLEESTIKRAQAKYPKSEFPRLGH